ncbi:MAG: type ISP restriction/modification enzyme [Polyangiaceae bacterium]|nr:type ISP restriction/modification enzyme [Polyangiaceae bacterium]
MSALLPLLDRYRAAAATHREQGTYFEELTICYLKNEPVYRELYREVLPYAEWAERHGLDKRDTGIDLVAETVTGDAHAIQCKLYASDYRMQKSDIDSFFTASGKKPFTHRIIVSTTSLWSEHAEEALRNQHIPVTKIDLIALENSVIDWSRFAPSKPPVLQQKKSPRPHQSTALNLVVAGLQSHDRGKLIMACGTGKTFTSLKIAERIAGNGKRVLFLVPSLALLSQSLSEWTQESALRLRSYAVCSDSDVGKQRKKDDDTVQTFTHELHYPATTNAAHLAAEMHRGDDAGHMSVVFATYHSISVVHEAQQKHDLPEFDLIICDEAHRTTGANFEGEEESHFIKIHEASYVRGAKRLYMTATPRIYGDTAKATAERDNVALCSMDDEALYGRNLYTLTFSEAVKRGLLVDYKVIVLSVEESHVSRRIQNLLKDQNNQLRVDDAAKIVGCWKALAKQGLSEQLTGDDTPMRRAVAFCQVIERQKNAKVHKVSSKHIAEMFQAVVEAYQETEPASDNDATRLHCEAAHVDGSMNATQKEEKIAWLKAATAENTCRILSNVRCLSEGVDVPALDAVLFLTPRTSQVDVVQSVGRVMRNAPGKKRGYIVLPVVIPAGVEPHEALNDNETYKIVWQVLQALRSHDDRFDAMINKLDLTGKDPAKMEVIAITDNIAKPSRRKKGDGQKAVAKKAAKGGSAIGSAPERAVKAEQRELEFEIGEIERAIYAKLVQKVGNRHHWEDWAKDIAKIARTHVDRITGILENEANTREREAFERFADELRDDLNDSITRDEIIEMLAQHLVTKPVFEALFSGHSFATENAMSRAMQSVLDALHEHHLEKEASTLEAFYESVKLRAEGIDSAAGKQKIVVELYDKFFRNAFPKMSERLGIVYTPVEIVDFILKSVDHLLRTEFGQTLGSQGVHILDPFAGTGTFITRLLQSGLISKDELPRKYAKEIHANEIVLLAYYIAAINIEASYHDIIDDAYRPFEGICLTDTFQLYEKDDLISRVLVDNSARRTRQKQLDIRVILGNPPYSVGQDSQNDNNQNVAYPLLDQRIAETYATRSAASSSKALYDSYVRAIRWASDRIGTRGIIGFVTNANFIEAGTTDGMRRCLAEEFSSLYVFHLRGNQRTAGERSKQEGGKVFGSGSRAPVAISLFVKNPNAKESGRIHFLDVGQYLTREDKLAAVASFGSIAGIAAEEGWSRITPDAHGDWLKQRDEGLSQYLPVGIKDKGDASPRIFNNFSLGVATARDAWACSPSKRGVGEQMARMITFYNSELARFDAKHRGTDRKARSAALEGFIDTDPVKVSWTRALKNELAKGERLSFDKGRIVLSLYRPFSKHWLYFDRKLNDMVYQMPRLFPRSGVENRVIGVSASESRSGYSVLMADVVPSLHCADMVGSQFFPLYLYDGESSAADDDAQASLFSGQKGTPSGTARRDAITDAGLEHFKSAYPREAITKEDIFYYVYGILHSPEYRERYADNLGKELPRIPRMKAVADFWSFSRAGRTLGDLHVGYERVPEYTASIEGPAKPTGAQYRVEKMKFGKGKDRSVIHYNDLITVRDVPLEAYEYVVNGKSAIEWVMERQSVITDKDSGIVKDANAWATETAGDARYPLSLLLRIITVSLETINIVKALPALDILDEPTAAAKDTVVPFRRVTPKADERFKACVPLVELQAAAGTWSDVQENIAEPDHPDVEWITWDTSTRFAKGMFVARIRGRSMEPTIPDGAYCLFRRVALPSSPDRPVLVRYSGQSDPETGGQYTVKLYRERQGTKGRKQIALQPANTEFAPIVIAPGKVGEIRVIAEVVEVLAP